VAWHVPVSAGMMTGFFEQRFANMRMGLAAHLGGVLNGVFLIALGAVWTEVRLPPSAKTVAYWTVLYGAYVNWLTTALAAVLGTAALSPIAAEGHRGLPWQETLVTAGFVSVGIVMVASAVLILWGLHVRAAR
jgi:hydroxylaminobenzene mutase